MVKNFDASFSRFDRIPACDGRTDGQTSCHGIVRAMHTRRAVKFIDNFFSNLATNKPTNIKPWSQDKEILACSLIMQRVHIEEQGISVEAVRFSTGNLKFSDNII